MKLWNLPGEARGGAGYGGVGSVRVCLFLDPEGPFGQAHMGT